MCAVDLARTCCVQSYLRPQPSVAVHLMVVQPRGKVVGKGVEGSPHVPVALRPPLNTHVITGLPQSAQLSCTSGAVTATALAHTPAASTARSPGQVISGTVVSAILRFAPT